MRHVLLKSLSLQAGLFCTNQSAGTRVSIFRQRKPGEISGADSGIGRAVAIAFAKEGSDILLSYLPEEEPDAAEVVAAIEKAGRTAIKLPGDIRKPEYSQALVAAALKEFGRLDIVVNNAGFQMTHDKLEDVPLDEVKRTFDTNIFGTFALTQVALKELKRGASILNTTSIQAYQPGENLVAYAATKAAVLNMAKSAAKLAMEQGRTCKCRCTRTSMDAADSLDDAA